MDGVDSIGPLGVPRFGLLLGEAKLVRGALYGVQNLYLFPQGTLTKQVLF